MRGLKALGILCASLAVALALDGLACLLPDNPYQRWQLSDSTVYDQLRWAYERIHYDDRPVDVAIFGPSRSLLGLSAERIGQQLSGDGEPAQVANFSVVGAGRNIQWAIADELFKAKSPKVLVLAVEETPYGFGHSAFKLVAPASAVAFPPARLLHNAFYDLAYLPSRQVKLFASGLFPDLFGLRKTFDPGIYAGTRSEFTSGILHLDHKIIDMDGAPSPETLRKQAPPKAPPALSDRLLRWCCNDGDDHVYIAAIAELARAHGTRLIFAFLPVFDSIAAVEDRAFLSRYGLVVDNGDMAHDANVYENWSHFNHTGAVKASDRVASAIAAMKTSNLDRSDAK